MSSRMQFVMVICCFLVASVTIAAETVDGPYKPQELVVRPDNTETSFWYRASGRGSSRTVDIGRGKVFVDEGLIGYGVEAYLSLSYDLVVLNGTTKQTLWSHTLSPWYVALAFVHATDEKTGESILLLWARGKNGGGRLFDAKTGKEKYLEGHDKKSFASDENRAQLRGVPLKVRETFSGTDGRGGNGENVRVTSAAEWTNLWDRRFGRDRPIPEVDFSKEMVVGVFLDGSLSHPRLMMALDCQESVEVFVEVICPQIGGDPDLSGFRKTSSYELYVLPKRDGKLLIKSPCKRFIQGPIESWMLRSEFAPLRN